MGHNHSHNNVTGNIAAAFFLNSFFAVIELVGGILTNSIAILSDALHDFGDCLSLGVAWGLQKKSTQGRDNLYSYGYKRFSLLGTIFLSGVLTVSSAFVVVEAVKRLFAPQQVSPEGMLWMAVFGVIINGAAALKLKKGDSLSERAVFLHIMEDVLGWMAVLVVSVVMLFIDLPILDPLLSIAITIWVLSNVYKNMRQTIKILMQAVPIGMDIQALQNDIEAIDGVESLHDL
ncbi:MAG: cation diffusion facilitator family transporter, partial [Mucinivorans sp.]